VVKQVTGVKRKGTKDVVTEVKMGSRRKEVDGAETEDIDMTILIIVLVVKTQGMSMMSSSSIMDTNKTTITVTIKDGGKGEMMAMIMVIVEVIRSIMVVGGVQAFVDISGTEDIIITTETNIMKGDGMMDITTEVQAVTTIQVMTTEERTDIRIIVLTIQGEEKTRRMEVQREISRQLTTLRLWKMMCHKVLGQG